MTPDLITQLFDELLACGCQALDDFTVCGCPCRKFISVGPPVADLEACCSDGQLTVHLERVYAHGNFPGAFAGPITCQVPLAAELAVTLFRCQPAVKDDGSAPTPAELQAAAEDLTTDLYVLTNALICCLARTAKLRPFALLSATTLGPQGGCGGVQIRFAVQLTDPNP